MLKVSPTKAKIHTLKTFLQCFLGFNSLFIVFGVLSFSRIMKYGALEPFKIGEVIIPKIVVGGTNLSVFLLCSVGLTVITTLLLYRYFYYRNIIKKLREAGIYDFDDDGKVDTFIDNFLDENFYNKEIEKK